MNCRFSKNEKAGNEVNYSQLKELATPFEKCLRGVVLFPIPCGDCPQRGFEHGRLEVQRDQPFCIQVIGDGSS